MSKIDFYNFANCKIDICCEICNFTFLKTFLWFAMSFSKFQNYKFHNFNFSIPDISHFYFLKHGVYSTLLIFTPSKRLRYNSCVTTRFGTRLNTNSEFVFRHPRKYSFTIIHIPFLGYFARCIVTQDDAVLPGAWQSFLNLSLSQQIFTNFENMKFLVCDSRANFLDRSDFDLWNFQNRHDDGKRRKVETTFAPCDDIFRWPVHGFNITLLTCVRHSWTGMQRWNVNNFFSDDNNGIVMFIVIWKNWLTPLKHEIYIFFWFYIFFHIRLKFCRMTKWKKWKSRKSEIITFFVFTS